MLDVVTVNTSMFAFLASIIFWYEDHTHDGANAAYYPVGLSVYQRVSPSAPAVGERLCWLLCHKKIKKDAYF